MPKWTVLTLLGLLVGCQPLVNQLQGAELKRTPSGLALKNLGPSPMTGDLSQEAPENAIALFVVGPISGPEQCQEAAPNRFYCYLPPTLDPGASLSLDFEGPVERASVTYYRPDTGPRPYYIRLD